MHPICTYVYIYTYIHKHGSMLIYPSTMTSIFGGMFLQCCFLAMLSPNIRFPCKTSTASNKPGF